MLKQNLGQNFVSRDHADMLLEKINLNLASATNHFIRKYTVNFAIGQHARLRLVGLFSANALNK